MVVIRLRRAGSKKRPFFRVVVTDSRAARDSSFVEILGHYNPRSKPAIVDVNRERMDYWLKKGAQPSDTVRTLLARHFNPSVKTPYVRIRSETLRLPPSRLNQPSACKGDRERRTLRLLRLAGALRSRIREPCPYNRAG